MSVQVAALGAVLRVGRVWIGIARSLLLKVPVPPGRTSGLEDWRVTAAKIVPLRVRVA